MSTQTVEKESFEIEEPAQETAEGKLPTAEEARAQGLTAKEIERAEKHGLLAKAPEKPKEEPKPEKKAEEPKAEEKPVEGEETKPDAKPRGTLPDFTFKTPEQEKVFLDAFGPGTPQRAMYFRMKNERQARQAERARAEAAEKKAQELEARLSAIEAGRKHVEVDDEGNEIDPDEKPLTMKQLREMREKEAAEAERKQQEQEVAARRVSEAQEAQEEYARSLYEDYDDTVKLAKEVGQNLDKLLPEKWQQAKAIKLIRDLQIAAANADKLDLDDYHGALIAYELGRLHPKYGQKAGSTTDGPTPEPDGNTPDPKKANGGLTPEQMKRIEENTRRRASSASIQGGGGRRVVSADDVTSEDLARMTSEQWQAFRKKYPDRYAKLIRG